MKKGRYRWGHDSTKLNVLDMGKGYSSSVPAIWLLIWIVTKTNRLLEGEGERLVLATFGTALLRSIIAL